MRQLLKTSDSLRTGSTWANLGRQLRVALVFWQIWPEALNVLMLGVLRVLQVLLVLLEPLQVLAY